MSPQLLQWSVVAVDLDPVVGSEQAGRRSVVIVSRETANAALPVVTALPLTTRKPHRRVYPNEALIPEGKGGLNHESIAMAHQLRTLSKKRLGKTIGRIDDADLRSAIKVAMRIQLDLE